ncbi:ADP-ribosylglycohydrolase family protein [Pelovirga terrestris]|uniref:ADP-ribosylglycohydrolase family protein n=1 Tax=Pelovirga terrestris TaxID=2771352 RepID=A0A8J6UQ13_9BACT|nr:ADP-ribosylglycohydrolase family protein [Pelovirga terrestris]MBD1401339.1 ADP-ribosylglycohydrolase family protein [Pelovirga terrestris]
MNLSHKKVEAALKNMFVADALAMPVHWFYNPVDIEKAFPGGVTRFEAAPAMHPSSIMSLHSTLAGGRGVQQKNRRQREIVGDVILKGKRPFWGQPNQHYHQGMLAGDNTLNAHCARVLIRTLTANRGHYDKQRFLDDYIDFMTAYPPRHPDTYAESYHRGFFANLESGKPRELCAAKTHDTPSIGGLVTIAPIVFSERLQGVSLSEVKEHCLQHLYLTHPDEMLAGVCGDYVQLLDDLLFRDPDQDSAAILVHAAKNSCGLDLENLTKKSLDDRHVVGRVFSSACYITDSWPSVLYLAYKYAATPQQALLANTNLGGDNVHRGIVLGVLLGLITGEVLHGWFDQLSQHLEIIQEINALMATSITEG